MCRTVTIAGTLRLRRGQRVSIDCGGGRIHLRRGVYVATDAALAFAGCQINAFNTLADTLVALPNFDKPPAATARAPRNSTLSMTDCTTVYDCVVCGAALVAM
jgi:hypothetical protein